MNIVFLNLLISVVGDQYDEMMINKKRDMYRSLAELILEFEAYFSEKKEEKKYLYIFKVSEIEEREEKEAWEGRIKATENAINKMST